MSTATLARMVRDPRSGEIHLPNETVAVLSVIRNLDRTLLKVRWQAGGDCVVFRDDLEANHCIPSSEAAPSSSAAPRRESGFPLPNRVRTSLRRESKSFAPAAVRAAACGSVSNARSSALA